MTKTFLRQNFTSTFKFYLLFNKGSETLLAASQRIPTDLNSSFCYLPMKEDFEKVTAESVVAIIANVNYKST